MPTCPESNENNRKIAQILRLPLLPPSGAAHLHGEGTNMYIGLIIINFEQLKCLSWRRRSGSEA